MYVYEFSGGSARGRFESMVGKSCQQREGMLDRDLLAGQHGERITIIINEGPADIYRVYHAPSPEFSRPPVLDKVRPIESVSFVGASGLTNHCEISHLIVNRS